MNVQQLQIAELKDQIMDQKTCTVDAEDYAYITYQAQEDAKVQKIEAAWVAEEARELLDSLTSQLEMLEADLEEAIL